jgi:hypothetical protein
MSLARLSRLRSAALRLNGDQTAENGDRLRLVGERQEDTPDVGSSAVAAPTMVMPKPCPTMDSSVPRPTSKRRIDGAGQRPAGAARYGHEPAGRCRHAGQGTSRLPDRPM